LDWFFATTLHSIGNWTSWTLMLVSARDTWLPLCKKTNTLPGPVNQYRFVKCRLRSELLVCFFQGNESNWQIEKTLRYYEICPFPTNYESVIFYSTGSRQDVHELFSCDLLKKLFVRYSKLTRFKFFYNYGVLFNGHIWSVHSILLS
jgi:hypothetical protein